MPRVTKAMLEAQVKDLKNALDSTVEQYDRARKMLHDQAEVLHATKKQTEAHQKHIQTLLNYNEELKKELYSVKKALYPVEEKKTRKNFWQRLFHKG